MDSKSEADLDQIARFKKLASEMGLASEPPESLDRVMGKLDLKKKPEKKDDADGKAS